MAFYPNKQMTTGEGGVVATNNEDWITQIRSLRNQGRKPGGLWLEHDRLGYNYRLDEMSAAFGLAQARRLPELLEKRKRVAGWYEERLRNLDLIRLAQISPFTTFPSWFVYVIRILPPASRDRVIERLAQRANPVAKIFFPDPPAVFLPRTVRIPAGRFPGDGTAGRSKPCAAVLRRDDRRRSGDGVLCGAEGAGIIDRRHGGQVEDRHSRVFLHQQDKSGYRLRTRRYDDRQ